MSKRKQRLETPGTNKSRSSRNSGKGGLGSGPSSVACCAPPASTNIAVSGANAGSNPPIQARTIFDETIAQFSALVRKAEDTPDPYGVGELRKFVREHPVLGEVIAELKSPRSKILERTSSGVLMALRSGELDLLKLRLKQGVAGPLQEMLVEHLLTCWLRLDSAERAFSQALYGTERAAIEELEWRQAHLLAMQRLLLQAAEALARIKRLSSRSTLQLNIAQAGGQQVNSQTILEAE